MSDSENLGVPLDIRVRFAETDAMGIVHHRNYIVWFEAGRVEWMDVAGVPYTEVAAGGNHFAVTAIEAQYRTPARFDDRLQVITRLTKLRSRKVTFTYEVQNAAGEILVTGSSDHICVDLDGRMAKIPGHVMERLQTGVTAL